MNKPSETEISEAIRSALVVLTSDDSPWVNGAPLGAKVYSTLGIPIKTATGLTLKDFILKNMSDVKVHDEVKQSFFSLNPDAESPRVTPTCDISVLDLYKRPKSVSMIAIKPTPISARIINKIEELAEGEHVVKPLTVENHKQIAIEFIDTILPKECKSVFADSLENESFWWFQWNTLFAEYFPQGRTKWVHFRNGKFIEAIQQEFLLVGASREDTDAFCRFHQRPKSNSPCQPLKASLNSDAMLRRVIQEVVSVMTIAELRQLMLPAGLLFDQIHAQK